MCAKGSNSKPVVEGGVSQDRQQIMEGLCGETNSNSVTKKKGQRFRFLVKGKTLVSFGLTGGKPIPRPETGEGDPLLLGI